MLLTKLLVNGLKGFAVFFSLTLFVEFFRVTVGLTKVFNIEIIDFYNSLLGIILFILVTITKHLIGEK